jgi:polysaccharide export outer membrane protein
MRTELLSSMLALAVLAAPAAARAQEAPAPAPAPPSQSLAGPRIAPRDQVKILVFNAGTREDAYSNTFLVDTDGAFEYPSVGRVKAMGLTPRELEVEIRKRLEQILRSPQVSIDVLQTGDKKIILNGEVRVPGEYPFSGQTTLFAMLTKAGSLTDTASEEAIVHRGSLNADGPTETIRVDLTDMISGESIRNNIPLEDGDVVVIPKSEPVYVYGYVQSTGALHVRHNTTVKQVLAMAGGISERGSTRGITIRRLVDGKAKEIKVEDIETDLVQPGDTLTVHARLF